MKTSRSILRIALVVLVGIEMLWLVLANGFLNTDLGHRLANFRPQKLSLEWENGWTLYPAQIHTNNLIIDLHTPTIDIAIQADQIDARIHLLPLLFKRLVIDHASGGLASAVLNRTTADLAPRKSTKPKPKWLIELRDLKLNYVNKLVFNDVEISGGEARVEGTVVIQPGRESTLEQLAASWQQADIQLANRQVSNTVNAVFNVERGSFNPRTQKGMALFENFSGDLKIDGSVGSLAPLRMLFPKSNWIESLDGEGEVDINLIFDSGTLRAGSVVDVDATGLELNFLGFRARGFGRVDGSVVQLNGEQQSAVSVIFDQFSLARHDAAAPLALGEGLRLDIKAPALGPSIGLKDVTVELDIPESKFPDITVLGSNLPAALGLVVTDGNAALQGYVHATGADQEVSGTVLLSGRGLKGRFRDMGFELDMDINSRLSGKQLDEFRVDLNGTEFKLFNGIFDNEEVEVDDQWWMTISAPNGYAKLSSPAIMEADVSLAMKDTRAIIAIFAEIKDWVKYFNSILTIRDVAGTAKISAADQKFLFQEINVSGEQFELMAELKAESGVRDGIFWGKRGLFSIGVEHIDQQTNWKLIGGRAWYEKKKAENWGKP